MKLLSKKSIYLLASFLIPFVLLGLVYALNQIYPFSSKSILINDMYAEYIHYYTRLYDVFYHGKSLFFSWETGMGLNFLGTAAYYLALPLSFIILFFKRENLPEAIWFLTLVKVGLSGTFMYIFLRYFNKKGTLRLLLFSTLYALIGYSIIFSFNLMWIDGVFMLPLVLLGVELLLNKGKVALFIISLAIVLVANFFIAYMVCIFAFLYFIVRYFSTHEIKQFSVFIKKFLLFGVSGGIGAGLSAFMTLPTYLELKSNVVTRVEQPIVPTFHLSNLYLKFFSSQPDSLSNGLPNIYAGLLALLLFPLFFFSKKIKLKEKILFLLLFAFMIFSFKNAELNYIWHGMHNSKWFLYRYSFLVSFLVLYLAFRIFNVLEKIDLIYLTGIYIVDLLFILFMYKNHPGTMSIRSLTANVVILTVYTILLYGKTFWRKREKWIHVLLLLTVCVDVAVNSFFTIRLLDRQLNYEPRSNNVPPSNLIAMNNWLKDHDRSFYRMNNLTQMTWNDAFDLDYKKMDSYNSMNNNAMDNYLNQLGYSIMQDNFIQMNDGIISSDSLLGFKYIISKDPIRRFGYTFVHKEGNLSLYKNENALSLGFIFNMKNRTTFPTNVDNPFEKQNHLFGADLFAPINPISVQYENLSAGANLTKIDITKPAFITYTLPVKVEQELYSMINTNEVFNRNIYVNNKIIKAKYPTYYDNRAFELGDFKQGSVKVKVEILSNTSLNTTPLFYGLDRTKFENLINQIKSQTLHISSFADTNITGTINAQQKGTMFFSIPYDKGWSVKIDGKNAKVKNLGAFVGADVEKGNHKVELHYVPPGFHVGLLIAACSLLLLLLLSGLLLKNEKKLTINRNTQHE